MVSAWLRSSIIDLRSYDNLFQVGLSTTVSVRGVVGYGHTRLRAFAAIRDRRGYHDTRNPYDGGLAGLPCFACIFYLQGSSFLDIFSYYISPLDLPCLACASA